jgi:hypothetical protein
MSKMRKVKNKLFKEIVRFISNKFTGQKNGFDKTCFSNLTDGAENTHEEA